LPKAWRPPSPMTKRSGRTERRKVLIVDDHEIMRHGLTQLINNEEDLVVCSEAADVPGALAEIAKERPDIVLVDLTLSEGSGIELIKDIKNRWGDLPVLVLSMHDQSFYAERSLRAGARGYVSKSEVSGKVIDGIREVLAGNIYVGQEVASKMLHRVIGGGSDIELSPIDRLSDREFEVFELIGQGLQMRGIAQKLHLSVKTIEAHRENIKKKLNLEGAPELLAYAVQWTQFERDS